MGWRTDIIKHGDTLQKIALRNLGTAARWWDISGLNNLVPPYIADTASQGVLAYGQTILIPVVQPDSIATPPDPFLTDLALDTDGFLVVVNGDLATVSQDDNLKQSLGMRVQVGKLSMLFHPEYGSWVDSLVGSINTAALAQLAEFYATSAMIEDPRVQSVLSINGSLLNDTITLHALVQPVYGEAIVFDAQV